MRSVWAKTTGPGVTPCRAARCALSTGPIGIEDSAAVTGLSDADLAGAENAASVLQRLLAWLPDDARLVEADHVDGIGQHVSPRRAFFRPAHGERQAGVFLHLFELGFQPRKRMPAATYEQQHCEFRAERDHAAIKDIAAAIEHRTGEIVHDPGAVAADRGNYHELSHWLGSGHVTELGREDMAGSLLATAAAAKGAVLPACRELAATGGGRYHQRPGSRHAQRGETADVRWQHGGAGYTDARGWLP